MGEADTHWDYSAVVRAARRAWQRTGGRRFPAFDAEDCAHDGLLRALDALDQGRVAAVTTGYLIEAARLATLDAVKHETGWRRQWRTPLPLTTRVGEWHHDDPDAPTLGDLLVGPDADPLDAAIVAEELAAVLGFLADDKGGALLVLSALGYGRDEMGVPDDPVTRQATYKLAWRARGRLERWLAARRRAEAASAHWEGEREEWRHPGRHSDE